MQKDRQNMRHYERNVLYNGRPIDLRLISSVSVLFRTLVRLNSDTFVRLRTLSYRVRLSSISLFKFRTLPFNFGPFHPILTSDSSVRFQMLPLDFEQSRPISTDSINFGYFRPVSDAGTVLLRTILPFLILSFDLKWLRLTSVLSSLISKEMAS